MINTSLLSKLRLLFRKQDIFILVHHIRLKLRGVRPSVDLNKFWDHLNYYLLLLIRNSAIKKQIQCPLKVFFIFKVNRFNSLFSELAAEHVTNLLDVLLILNVQQRTFLF